METLASHRCFGGTLAYHRHAAHTTQCDMRFSAFTPARPTGAVLIYLSGLTCTEDNFTVKAGAYRTANALGLSIIAPDTSPRGAGVPDSENIAIGGGAGWYVDATEAPWNTHYRMYSYITEELVALARTHFGAAKLGLFGHSMGGHGTLTIALKNPTLFQSLSVFAPVCTPSRAGWGQDGLRTYLGDNPAAWEEHDALALMQRTGTGTLPPLLIDQGLADGAYNEGRLNPDLFVEAARAKGQAAEYRTHEGYDHGYFFIQTFIDDHLHHHAKTLGL